jgi:hypothetical protein
MPTLVESDAYNEYKTRQKRKQYFLKEYHQPQGLHDTERKKCYRAEWDAALAFSTFRNGLTEDTDLLSEAELREFADRVTRSKTYEKIRVNHSYGPVRVQMMQNRSGGIGGKATYNKIWIKPRCATKYLVLHELTHAAGYMNHGVGFRVALLKLVSRFLGTAYAKILKDCFKKQKLKTTMPKINIKSYEEWSACYKRMQDARASKKL